MAMINPNVKEVIKYFDTPSKLNSTIEIKSIRDTVVMKDSGPNSKYYLYEKKETDSDELQNNEITVTTPTGTTVTVAEGLDSSASYELNQLGLYVIRYKCLVAFYTDITDQTIVQNFTFHFNIACVPDYAPRPLWNIRSVIERLCNVIIPHKESEPPFYKLDPAQAEEFEKIIAPEFAFTQLTFKEMLDQIGGYIHGVVRLIKGESGKFDTIHYDMLGGTEVAPLSLTIGQWQKLERERFEQILDEQAPDVLPDMKLEGNVLTIGKQKFLSIQEPAPYKYK